MREQPDGFSEYDGRGVMPNTVHPKETEALTASDQLRLQSITGQEVDSRAPVDPYFWQGNQAPDMKVVEAARREREVAERALFREQLAKYRETRDSTR